MAWGDYDNDGDLDITVGKSNASNHVYRQNGDGSFSSVWNSVEGEGTNSVKWGDYDNDGDLDMTVGNYPHTNRVYRQNDDGSFSSVWNTSETKQTNDVAWGDYDNDGDLDILVGNVNSKTNRVYRQNGDGSFSIVWISGEIESTYGVAWGDYDNDGDLDMAVGTSASQTTRIYTGEWNQLTPNTTPSAPSSGFSSTVTVFGISFGWDDGSVVWVSVASFQLKVMVLAVKREAKPLEGAVGEVLGVSWDHSFE